MLALYDLFEKPGEPFSSVSQPRGMFFYVYDPAHFENGRFVIGDGEVYLHNLKDEVAEEVEEIRRSINDDFIVRR